MSATAVSEKINLCEFLRLTASFPKEELRLPEFCRAVKQLDIPNDLLTEHIHFTSETYARNLLVVTPRFEMIVMCWKPGQLSTIHDHLDSFALSYVYRGVLTNRNFERLDDGSRPGYAECQLVNEELIPAGCWGTVDVGGIHQMGNPPESEEDLVTIHFYARPLREINVFHPKDRRVERVRLLYSLLHF